MNTHDRADRRAATCVLEDDHSAEAIADCRHAAVDLRTREQDFARRLHTPDDRAPVAPEFADLAHDPFAVPCHAFAIHVAGEGHEPGLGEASRPPARVIVEPGAAVHDENARPFAGTLRVAHKKPGKSSVPIAVDDRFGLQSHTVLTVTP